MKKITILIIAVLISANVEARRGQARDIPAVIYFHDGTQIEGFVRPLAVDAKRVEYRAERGGRIERFQSNSISRIRRYDEESESFAEIVWLPWITTNRSGSMTRQLKPRWLTVVIVGPVTLYRLSSPSTHHYLVKKENEEVPKLISMVHLARNAAGGPTLSATGWRYFENSYPELAERIRNGEYRNTSADVRAVIHEYNARAGQR